MSTFKIVKKLLQQLIFFYLTCLTNWSSLAETQSLNLLVPKEIVESFAKTYSSEEMNLINIDLKNIRETSFFGKTPAKTTPIYVATAGGPGACKSTILETYLHDKLNFVYIDPDQRALKYMINAYYQSTTYYEISINPSYTDVQKNAYTKWRNASNYIANTMLNEAFAGGYNIAHGATSTTSAIESLYKKLKQKNYKIILLLCYATDETRITANDHRLKTQGFVQATQEDIINKGKMFCERFPSYFEYADEIQLYWTENFLKGSIHAATYTKNKEFIVHDNEALNHFITKYNLDRKNTPSLPSLDELIQTRKIPQT